MVLAVAVVALRVVAVALVVVVVPLGAVVDLVAAAVVVVAAVVSRAVVVVAALAVASVVGDNLHDRKYFLLTAFGKLGSFMQEYLFSILCVLTQLLFLRLQDCRIYPVAKRSSP